MTQGAYVEIYGYLVQDIQFQEVDTYEKYGVIIVELDRELPFFSHTSNPKNEHMHIPIIITNQELLENCSTLLKQDAKIWLVGELDILNHKRVAMNLPDNNVTDILQQSIIVINVKHKSGISFLNLPPGSEARKEECKYFCTS